MILNWLKTHYRKSAPGTTQQLLWARLYRLAGRNHFKVSGERNVILLFDSLLHNVTFDIAGNDNQVKIGPGARLANTLFRLRGHHHTVEFGEGSIYQGGKIWVEDDHTRLSIGAKTTVVEAQISVTEPGSRIEIGADCMFANGIDIRCGDSHSIIDLSSGQRINYARDVMLGNHIWVAAGATILKGVQLGDNCMVASHALVTRSFPANCLVGGSPAVVLRENITWKRERIPLLKKESE